MTTMYLYMMQWTITDIGTW